MPQTPAKNDPISLEWLQDHTVIIDRSDPSADQPEPVVSPEEIAADQSMKKLKKQTRKAKRQKGAQPGNNNALKFGFRELSAPEDHEPEGGSGVREGYTEYIAHKRGAQPGNNNALKYGFYSRRLPHRELEGLDQTTVNSLKDEIEVMRVFSRKVAELGSSVEDLETATGLLRVKSPRFLRPRAVFARGVATTSINRLVRTHTRIPDPDLDPGLLLKTALLELEDEWPELKAFGDQFRNKPAPAPLPPDQPGSSS